MHEKTVIFDSGPLKLEGLFNDLSKGKGVVVAHPHPQYGGDMRNNVVEAICDAYNGCGYASLRFNFRGVGRSEGTYDNGIGEQEDLLAAIGYLSDAGIDRIDLAGYSFGSWVIALGIKRFEDVNRVVMVSPPVDIFDYSSLENSGRIKLVIAGSEDEIADWRSVDKVLPLWNPDARLKVIKGADHFFWGMSKEIKGILADFLKSDSAGM